MTPYDRHLQAAQGYLELGLPLEAHEEIEDIEPEMRTLSEALAAMHAAVAGTGSLHSRQHVVRALSGKMLFERRLA